MKTNSFSITIISALTFLLLSTAVQASGTPDGMTPANEGVCDPLVGRTPGLYGLCVAYCEAQDLDAFDSKPSSMHILENYRKKMAAGDPDMPCVQTVTACPCWTPEELEAITGSLGSAECYNDGIYHSIDESDGNSGRRATVSFDDTTCSYRDSTLTTETSVIAKYMEITWEQADTCAAQIVQRCEALGL